MSKTSLPTHGWVAGEYHEPVNVAKPCKVNAARSGRESALGCFCEVTKGGRQEPEAE